VQGSEKESGKRSVAGKPASSIEAQAGSGESVAFRPGWISLDDAAEKRGRCEDGPGDDHLPPKPEGADEILLFGAAELADRQRRDRSGMQDLDQAPPMQIWLALEGRWGSRRIVDTRAATHYRPLGRVLAEPRPIWPPHTPRVTSYCASTQINKPEVLAFRGTIPKNVPLMKIAVQHPAK